MTYDVAIVGAGPAGTTCALAVKGSGLRVAVLDKAVFPRDKVCGDAIPTRVVQVLQDVDPEVAEAFAQFGGKVDINGSRIVAPNQRACELRYSDVGYMSRRIDFDTFLFEQAQARTNTDFFPGTPIRDVVAGEDGVEILAAEGQTFRAKMVVGCDGAHSVVARALTETKVDRDHYCGAVRAYYKNVADVPGNLLEVYLEQDHLPGYFWIFPLPGGFANVGFGMLSRTISDRSISLKKSLEAIIAATPELAVRFADAERVGPVVGFGLPLGSRKVPVSGRRFLLTGDAASLIDPVTGDGIGTAMLSAKLAAEQIIRCFRANDFSAPFMRTYDAMLDAKARDEFQQKYTWQRLISERAWLVNLIIGQVARNGWVRRKVQQTL
ncbi:MAG TPA: geranylgeranyl reductase family protein [Rhodothermales bacterium]|nr:geranylgeranyl reductase family protein [Rhodothermales bacterium]